jgi:hypothetical protein
MESFAFRLVEADAEDKTPIHQKGDSTLHGLQCEAVFRSDLVHGT